MSFEDLLCAACGGRVGDGRCPTCRAARQRLQPSLPAGAVLLCALIGLLLLLALV